MKNFLILFLICLSFPIISQHRVGVRAGMNYSKFSGSLETNESYGISNGFHFGINYTYEFSPELGIRAELLYTQRGTKQSYSGETYNIINPILPTNAETFVEIGQTELDMNLSNAFLSIPITVQYRLNRKIELFGGMSIDFLVGPSGRGKYDFTSSSRPDDIRYIQSFDHAYGSDVAGEFNDFIQSNISIRVDGDIVTLPKIVGGYYNFSAAQREMGDRIKGLDANIIAGFNYFINPGFYVGLRLEYGLLDLTNNAVDFSLNELDADDNYIFRDDSDKSIGAAISFGFRF